MEIWQVKNIKVKDLIPNAKNPRKISKAKLEQLKSKIERLGFHNPVKVDEEMNLLGGNQRVKALLQMGAGELEIPVMIPNRPLTKKEKDEIIITDNISDGEWDFDILKEEWDTKELKSWGLEWDFDDTEDEEVEIIEDEVPEEVKTRCNPGEIWQLGEHRLMCGDSTSISDVEKLMDGVKVDLLITDPPYNVAYEGGTKEKLTILNDKMDNDSFRQFLRDAFTTADAVMKPGAVFYIWHADSEGYNFRGACFDVNWKVRQCLIWNKNQIVMGRQDYHWKHEPCLYGWKDGASHLWASDRKQSTVIEFDKPQRNGEHPTMKPVGLFDYQIKNNTKKQDIVLDLFGGSGTTIVACEQNGRIAYSMELDEHYCDVIIQRWENLTGRKAKKL
jgi:site-specific DNA-methyltransferase (adenine-specific)